MTTSTQTDTYRERQDKIEFWEIVELIAGITVACVAGVIVGDGLFALIYSVAG